MRGFALTEAQKEYVRDAFASMSDISVRDIN